MTTKTNENVAKAPEVGSVALGGKPIYPNDENLRTKQYPDADGLKWGQSRIDLEPGRKILCFVVHISEGSQGNCHLMESTLKKIQVAFENSEYKDVPVLFLPYGFEFSVKYLEGAK